jgi:AraC-like DNA-binding protein
MPTVGIAFNRAVQLQPFIAAYRSKGGDPAPVLAASGLEHFDLSDPAALITGNALYGAIQRMSDDLGDPYFAARVAENFVEAGPVFVRESYAAAHTLGEFLPLVLMELDRQISNIRYGLTIKSDITVVTGERRFMPTVPVVQADAAAVTNWCTLLRLLGGDAFDPARLTVTVQERGGIPPDVVPRCSVLVWKWNGISVAFPSEWLRWPMAVNWRFPPQPRGEFADPSHRDAILGFLRRICIDRLGDTSFNLEALASLFGVHPRSLQRLLKQLGTSMDEIQDTARRDRAIQLMRSSEPVRIGDLAEMLGFSGAPAFSRAFKRWTGLSPSEFRRRL